MKQKFTLLQILGIGLILSGALLLLFSQLRMQSARKRTAAVTAQMAALLPERTPGIPGSYTDPAMPVLEINGVDYVALLDIPAVGSRLPVSSQWDDRNLDQSPCRFWGSSYEESLVIGGSDSPGQFDFCGRIHPGAAVILTAMNGEEFHYTIRRIDRAKHAESQWLLQDSYDLTLFTRGAFSMEYIAVRCVLDK